MESIPLSGTTTCSDRPRKFQQVWKGLTPPVVRVCTVDEPLREVGTNGSQHCGLCVWLICHCQILAPSTQGKTSGPAASVPSESRLQGWGVINALSLKCEDLS